MDELDARSELDASVSRQSRPVSGGDEDVNRPVELAGPSQRVTEEALELEPLDVVVTKECRRALEHVRSRDMVGCQQGSLADLAKPVGGFARPGVTLVTGRRVAGCTLQVRADQLVSFPTLLEPTRHVPVHLSPLGPTDATVRSPANERVDELVLACSQSHESASPERREPAVELRQLYV